MSRCKVFVLQALKTEEIAALLRRALADELRAFLRASGHGDISELSLDDLCTVSSEISENTGIRHA